MNYRRSKFRVKTLTLAMMAVPGRLRQSSTKCFSRSLTNDGRICLWASRRHFLPIGTAESTSRVSTARPFPQTHR